MKTFRMSLLAVLATSGFVSVPGSASDTATFRSGVVAGVHGGVNYMWGRVKANLNSDAIQAATPGGQNAAGSSHKASAFGGVLVGYRHFIKNDWSVGLDATFNIYGNDALHKRLVHGGTTPFNVRYTRPYNVIPSFTIGYVFADRFHTTLGLGVAVSRFRHEILNVLGTQKVKRSFTRAGFAPSLGLEYAVTPRWSVTGQASYEWYGRLKRGFGSETNPTVAGISYTTNFNPNILTGRLGVTYKF